MRLPACLAMVLLGSARIAAAESTFYSVLDEVGLRAEVGTGIYGDELTGNLGVQSLGLRDFGGRWLVSWNGGAELVLGGVAYEHPYDWAYGAQGQAHGEGGIRLMPGRRVSPYLSVGLDGSLSAVTEVGVPFDQTQYVNNLDDFGGVIGTMGARLGFGVSFLGPRQSLLLEAQPLAELDSAQANLSQLSYFGGGLHARYDRRGTFVALGDASFEVTPAQAGAGLEASSVSSRWTLAGSALRKFGRHLFGGLAAQVSRTATVLTYATGQSYDTDTPVDARFSLLFGYWP